MKMKRFVILSMFVGLVLLAGCYHNEFTVEKHYIAERSKPSFTKLESAALYGDKYQGIDSCSADEKTFQEAILMMRRNHLDTANSILKSIKTKDQKLNDLIGFFLSLTENVYEKLGYAEPDFEIINDNKYKISVEDNNIYINVKIKDKKHKFLLDNGFQRTSINSKSKILMDLKKTEYSLNNFDINNKLSHDTLFLLNDEMQLANIKVKGLLISVSRNVAHYDGIIGMDILSKFDVRIDFKNKEITFKKPNPADLDTNYLYSWMEVPIYYGMSCNGMDSRFAIDLGANRTILFSKIFDYYHFPKKVVDSFNMDITGSNSKTENKVEIIKDVCFNLSGYNFLFSKVILYDIPRVLMFSVVGLLGNDLWQNGRIRLDYQNGIFQYEEEK